MDIYSLIYGYFNHQELLCSLERFITVVTPPHTTYWLIWESHVLLFVAQFLIKFDFCLLSSDIMHFDAFVFLAGLYCFVCLSSLYVEKLYSIYGSDGEEMIPRSADVYFWI